MQLLVPLELVIIQMDSSFKIQLSLNIVLTIKEALNPNCHTIITVPKFIKF